MTTCTPRLRLAGELEVTKTLADGHIPLVLGSTSDHLILGLGPDPAALAASLPSDARVSYIESPAFVERAGQRWRDAVPSHWIRLDRLQRRLGQHVRLYTMGPRLFPSFWNPILAELRLPLAANAPRFTDETVLMHVDETRLLSREIADAFRAQDHAVQDFGGRELVDILRQGRPELFFSVNFDGLDDYGYNHALLKHAGVPVVVWCVDNPFHALSRLKSPFWKEVELFVTDPWFVDKLVAHGATRVHHLPLAANPDFFQARPIDSSLKESILFVGRSAFPCRLDYFAGLKPPHLAWEDAEALLHQGERPDFGWWLKRLGIERCWPGKQARLAGLCAEECNCALRCLALTEAAKCLPLVVVGDDAWSTLIHVPFEMRPMVDYYGPLAGLYASARFTLGVTSPLLPAGLTQRHFDTWAAGGFLLSDATPGLSLFPAELVREMTYQTPAALPELVNRLEGDPALKADVATAWRELMLREHTYAHRVSAILERVRR